MKRLGRADERQREILKDRMIEAKADVVKAVETYNEVMAEAREFRDGIVERISEYVDARSEKWRESDTATEYDNWKDEWENLEAEDIEDPDMLDDDAWDGPSNSAE